MNLTISLTVDETNTVLGALSQMPYGQVATLIQNLTEQAQAQIEAARGAADATETATTEAD